MGFAENASTGEAITIGCLVIRDNNTRADAFNLARSIIRDIFRQAGHGGCKQYLQPSASLHTDY